MSKRMVVLLALVTLLAFVLNVFAATPAPKTAAAKPTKAKSATATE
jgi:hypothetical protein